MSTLAQRSCHSTTFLPSEPGILQGPREVQRPVQHNLPLTNTLMAQRWEQEEPEGDLGQDNGQAVEHLRVVTSLPRPGQSRPAHIVTTGYNNAAQQQAAASSSALQHSHSTPPGSQSIRHPGRPVSAGPGSSDGNNNSHATAGGDPSDRGRRAVSAPLQSPDEMDLGSDEMTEDDEMYEDEELGGKEGAAAQQASDCAPGADGQAAAKPKSNRGRKKRTEPVPVTMEGGQVKMLAPKEYRKYRRRITNRESARRMRRKRAEERHISQQEGNRLLTENEELKEQVQELEAENARLAVRNDHLEEEKRAMQSTKPQAGSLRRHKPLLSRLPPEPQSFADSHGHDVYPPHMPPSQDMPHPANAHGQYDTGNYAHHRAPSSWQPEQPRSVHDAPPRGFQPHIPQRPRTVPDPILSELHDLPDRAMHHAARFVESGSRYGPPMHFSEPEERYADPVERYNGEMSARLSAVASSGLQEQAGELPFVDGDGIPLESVLSQYHAYHPGMQELPPIPSLPSDFGIGSHAGPA